MALRPALHRMIPEFIDPLVTLYLGDCLEVMPNLESESVDAVVTDPPYGLGFMGKHWDHGVPAREFWEEMLLVAKPGAYLLAFGGTRTVHRIATNIEDAGWIIRDMLMWIYASGFPKGKANLKPAHEPIVLARKPGPLRPLAIDDCRIGTDAVLGRTNHITSRYVDSANGSREPHARTITVDNSGGLGRWPSNVLLSSPELFDVANPGVVGSGATTTSGSRTGEHDGSGAWSGPFGKVDRDIEGDAGGYSRFFIIPKADRAERERGLADMPKGMVGGRNRADGRQWDIPGSTLANNKPPRANTHPTVKPIDLMRHLVRLVTPPGGTVLDPFAGSGTTGLAASELGVKCIMIEREPEYCEIIKGRLMATPIGLGLFEDAPEVA